MAAPGTRKERPLAPMDRRLKQRIARGHELIDARIDLHGLTQDEAHRALVRFLRAAQADGARIALVITGKGETRATLGDASVERLGEERGVLRRLVPHWLSSPSLRDCVLGFEAAHSSHGGQGAVYVRIRRRVDRRGRD